MEEDEELYNCSYINMVSYVAEERVKLMKEHPYNLIIQIKCWISYKKRQKQEERRQLNEKSKNGVQS